MRILVFLITKHIHYNNNFFSILILLFNIRFIENWTLFFFQFTFYEVIIISWSRIRVWRVNSVNSSFPPFLIFFLIYSLAMSWLRIMFHSFFFFFAFYKVIVFSMNFYLVTRYDPSTFDFFKIDFFILISPFNIWLIENWFLHFVFFLSFPLGYPSLMSMIMSLAG